LAYTDIVSQLVHLLQKFCDPWDTLAHSTLAAQWRPSTNANRPIGYISSGTAGKSGDPPIPRPGRQPAVAVQLLDEHHLFDRGGHPRRTYKEALERFAHDYLATLKLMTQVRYHASFRQLASVLDTLYLDEITRGRLADYASARMKGAPRAQPFGVIWQP
jgi:hypothetical protein